MLCHGIRPSTANSTYIEYFSDQVLIDFSLTVKAVTLIFISGRCSASSPAKQEKSGSIYNLVKK